ncbi:MAG: carbamoyl-phosphate synthase (glutamine-hydrolyzing) large subunit [Phycisphaerales bacterium]
MAEQNVESKLVLDEVRSVIVLGSAALKIGEAGEFDYSGSQAIKALKEEGVRTILVNPNIATIQTSDHLADEVYFLPITPEFVERVIEKEKPDGILLSFGGQTALNCGIELDRRGVLDQHGVRVLGTPISTILDTEDRDRFVQRLNEIGALAPRSKAASTVEEAVSFARKLGFPEAPVMIRIAYALGGLGSGVCRDEEELRDRVGRALSHTSQVLIEEYLEGWKEIEYEVVRDAYDNCVTVCNMENFDPLGIHTGESIVVAPSQTLSNREYHMLREIAIRVIRHLGIVGECNIQYALDPASESYRIIEVNARLSRSSALASKATGYPLAFVAAKLALGYGLYELPNAITRVTKAFFEPALDYIVVKAPRWDLKKFRHVSRRIGSGMKSVGEVMAIGRTFEEAIQKALRMLETGANGLVGNPDFFEFDDLEEELRQPTERRIFAVVEALAYGMSIDRVHELSHIDKWFLWKIARVVELTERMKKLESMEIPADLLLAAKRAGFSDQQIGGLTDQNPGDVRRQRKARGVEPVIRQIDTLAAEYPARTNYLYLTYNGVEDDLDVADEKTVIILGSGAYRIGCSVEFDWCCVNAGMTLRERGYRTVMLNYNPETVSTDYDEFDTLFFDEISLETVQDVYEKTRAMGVIIAMGGQIPNNLAVKLDHVGVNVLGTSPKNIDRAENRHVFSSLLDELGIDQPEWTEATSVEEARAFADNVGYPVLIRPSYVLSGAAMAVAINDEQLERYLRLAAEVSADHPTVISKFIENAKEIEFDGVATTRGPDGQSEIVIYAISEHVENAGVHSGDATLVFPPQRTYLETIRRIRRIARKIVTRLGINGPFNIQFIAKDNAIKVIECNLRASRSFPFVSKILKQNLIEIGTRVIMGETPEVDKTAFELNYVGVKASQFSFTRLEGADPTLGVEMSSTGEVGCIGDDFHEAYLKSLISVGYRLPIERVLLSIGSIKAKAEMLEPMRRFAEQGVQLFGTEGTAAFLREHNVPVTELKWPGENITETVIDFVKGRNVDLVINIPHKDRDDELTTGYMIRRSAADHSIPLITNRQIATRFIEAVTTMPLEKIQIKSWGEYTKGW